MRSQPLIPTLLALVLVLFARPFAVAAATVTLDFERASNAAAIPGAEATDLYVALGVRFPSRPTIERDASLFTQVLQQAGPRGRTCGPLVMQFSAAMSVREVRMRVINRHLRRYAIQAFAERAAEVDSFVFRPERAGGPPFPSPRPYTDVVLRAAAGEPDITQVAATPPADCFDLMVVDNLVLETLHPPVPISPIGPVPLRVSVSVLAYEVSQGVMSRLTWPAGPNLSIPDTGLMALPDKKLPLLSGRNTGIRFFLESRNRPTYISEILSVDIGYRDGTRRLHTLVGKNTEGGPPRIEPRPAGATDLTLRRDLVMKRGRVTDSLDFVIPGPVLVNAFDARLVLSDASGRNLQAIYLLFSVGRSIGVNFVRVQGIGAASGAGVPPPAEPARSFLAQFLKDIYPVGQVHTRNFPIPFGVGSGFENCSAFLAEMSAVYTDATFESERELSTDYWTNLYLVGTPPPDCAALGFYNSPHSFVVNIFDSPHEIGHTIGLNHVTDLHTEVGSENWPYLHGSIGAVEETKSYDDGVFGLLMNLTPETVGADLITDWGTWQMGPVRPCRSQLRDASDLFPDCTVHDSNVMHDFMTYGAGDRLPKWGAIASTRWTSDINYYRIARFLEECIALDPVNRFWGPMPPQPAGTSTNAGCRAARGTGGQQPPDSGAARMESLVFSGVIPLNGGIESFRVLRKPVLPSVLAHASGDWVLTAFDANGLVLHKIPFRIRTSPAEGDAPESRSFSVVVPWEKQLSRISIANEQGKVVFEKSASANAPVLKLLSPQPGDVWQPNQGEGQPIEWLAMDSDQDAMHVFVQYSPDLGETWHPLAWLDENQKRHLVDIKGLEATEKALIYVSVTDGLHSDAVILPGAFAVRTGQ